VAARGAHVAALVMSLVASIACRDARTAALGHSGTAPSTSASVPRLEWKEEAKHREAAPPHLFWEAERPARTDYPPQNPFAPANAREADLLSGGAWIGAMAPNTRYFLEYELTLDRPGEHFLYARKFWQHGPFRWRFGSAPFQHVGTDAALLDSVPIRKHLSADWIFVGRAALGAGRHTLRIELDDDYANGASAWDAFVLAERPIHPQGRLRPGQTLAHAPAGFFPYEPDRDPFRPSPLDLRARNEVNAGDGGFVTSVGSAFVRSKSKEPIRFWGVNAGHSLLSLPAFEREWFARRLAKRGVNLLRLHGPIWDPEDISRVDAKKLESLRAVIAELKQNGIYTLLSIYSPLWMKPRKEDGFAGYDGKQSAFSLLYLNARFAELYRGWWRQILSAPSVDSAEPLAREPALALLELVNEDSIFFSTFAPYEDVPAEQMAVLEADFAAFLGARDGSAERALAGWTGPKVRGDDPAQGRVGVLGANELRNARGDRARRTSEFLAQKMRGFYADTARYLKENLGFGGSVLCSNWVTADGARLGPIDKWANLACDAMDQHGYFQGSHKGPAASHRISVGDTFEDRSALLLDEEAVKRPKRSDLLPTFAPRYGGKPGLVSELNWSSPNRFRAELPMFAAALGSVQELDALIFFAAEPPAGGGMVTKFGIDDPAILGQFPAASLIFRRGDIRPGPPALRVRHSLPALFDLDATPPARPGPLAFLQGPVEVTFENPDGGVPSAVQPLYRKDRRTATNSSGELTWNVGDGVFTLLAPRVEAVVGFLSRAPVELRALGADVPLDYGAVVLVALDDRPLASSQRMLLQVMSEVQNDGFAASGDGERTIADLGHPPLTVRRFAGSVTLRRSGNEAIEVQALDFNGYPYRTATGTGRQLPLLPDAIHYVLTVRDR
jgi:hypothetical protein